MAGIGGSVVGLNIVRTGKPFNFGGGAITPGEAGVILALAVIIVVVIAFCSRNPKKKRNK